MSLITENLILQTIKDGKSVADLVSQGLYYHQIARSLNSALDEELISYDTTDKLVLTEKGLLRTKEVSEKAIAARAGWIRPADKQRRRQRSISEVYVPPRSVISNLPG